ncbi:hypothetical protein ACFX4N_24130 [Priestia sp. YIM B13551]
MMNVEQLNTLLKRVNIEDNVEVKQSILSAIHKYLDTFTGGAVEFPNVELPENNQETNEETLHVEFPNAVVEEVEVEEVETSAIQPQPIQEDVILPAHKEASNDLSATYVEETQSATQIEEAQPVQQEVIETVQEEMSLPTETVLPVEPVLPVVELPKETLPQVEETKVEVPVETPAVVVETSIEEETLTDAAEEVELENEKVYVETFGLISPTNEKHMGTIIERGGVIYRDKRSFYLTLCLDDEIVAIAKTTKLEQFPENIRNYLKDGGFVSVEVVSFGEIVPKSRARYTDVTYKNLKVLVKDHWIVESVTNLLEKGEVPAHAKTEEKEVETEAPKEEVVTKEEVVEEEKPFLVASFLLHPNFVPTFETQKEAVLTQNYGITVAGSIARFYTTNASGTIVIGVQEDTKLNPNNYSAKILDYEMKKVEDKTFIQFKLDADVIGETVQAETAAPVEGVQQVPVVEQAPVAETVTQSVNVQTVPLGVVPQDFPLTNELTLPLHPKAETMFSLEAAKSMVGQAISLGFFVNPADQFKQVALMHDVFQMATGVNTLSSEAMRNSKWLAQLIDVDMVVDPQTSRKAMVIKFDQLWEVEDFAYEKAPGLNVLDFVPITDESFQARELELAKIQEAAKQEVASAEALLNKDYTPEEANQLLNPNPEANYTQGYQELVSSNSKDMGGAIEEIRTQTAMTPQSRQDVMDQAQGMVSGVITQTLQETGIRVQTEEKQPTQVVGNLQAGAGNLTQTETVIQFITGHSPSSWEKSVGKRIEVKSELHITGGGPVTSKLVSISGKENMIVAQGLAPITEALFVDGNLHQATIKSIEQSSQEQQGFLVTMRLGDFVKKA